MSFLASAATNPYTAVVDNVTWAIIAACVGLILWAVNKMNAANLEAQREARNFFAERADKSEASSAKVAEALKAQGERIGEAFEKLSETMAGMAADHKVGTVLSRTVLSLLGKRAEPEIPIDDIKAAVEEALRDRSR